MYVYVCVYFWPIRIVKCVCGYTFQKSAPHDQCWVVSRGILVSPFLSTHHVIAIAGLLENSGAGTQSWSLPSQKDSGKLKNKNTKPNKIKLLIWADALQQGLSRIKMHSCPNILARYNGFSPKIMWIPILWHYVASMSVGKPAFQWRPSREKERKGLVNQCLCGRDLESHTADAAGRGAEPLEESAAVRKVRNIPCSHSVPQQQRLLRPHREGENDCHFQERQCVYTELGQGTKQGAYGETLEEGKASLSSWVTSSACPRHSLVLVHVAPSHLPRLLFSILACWPVASSPISPLPTVFCLLRVSHTLLSTWSFWKICPRES